MNGPSPDYKCRLKLSLAWPTVQSSGCPQCRSVQNLASPGVGAPTPGRGTLSYDVTGHLGYASSQTQLGT